MKKYLVALLCLSTVFAFSQQNNVWRFGQGAGLDFNSGSPVAMTAGSIASTEPAASICDNQGQLLFYTDGKTVWNRNNATMSNGTGLSAGISTSQTIIVPKPGDCSKYYIFHSGDNITGNIGGYYSLVDMCLNGGLGDVVTGSKNIQITPNCSEKWTAIKHANGTDVWVLCHDLGSAQFRTYLVTSSGVSAPLLQTIGSVHGSSCMIGYMKASHSGQKLVASTTFNCGDLDMFDFNTATGQLSNFVDMDAQIGVDFYYGMEFSPNDQLLYLSDTYASCRVLQVNLVNYAVTTLATNGTNYAFGALQLGPDGKIYIARTGQNYIGGINSPNTVGAGCGYVNSAVTLFAGTTCESGLVNPAPWMLTSAAPQYVTLGNDTTLSCASPLTLAPASACNSLYLWNTGSTNDSLTISTQGTYWVEITNVCGIGRDTIVISGTSGNASAQFTTSGATLCGSQITFNNTSVGATTYNWNFGDNSTSTLTNPTHTYAAAGTYQVMLIASGACGIDTTYSTLVIDPSNTTAQFNAAGTSCGSPVNFTNSSSNATSYYWDFGDLSNSTQSNPVHTYSSAGVYQVMLIATGPCDIDTTYGLITITAGSVTAGFSSVPSACAGNPIFFSNGSSGASTYSWNFGDSGTSSAMSPVHIYSTPGTYTVTLIASSSCAADTSTSIVTINPVPTAVITGSDTICIGQSIVLTASGGTGFQWSGGSTATTGSITVSPTTTTAYYVQTNNGSCVSTPDTHIVIVQTAPVASISGATTICTGQSITLTASGASAYQWSGGSSATTSTITVSPTTTTVYYVTPISQCVGTPDTHTVVVVPVPIVSASGNTSICAGQSTTLTATGGTSYQWSGGSTDTTASITVSPSATTTYFVTASNGFCTSGFDTITVTVTPTPTVNIIGAQNNVCSGDTITLTAVGTATTYVWGGGASGSGQTVTVNPTSQTNYWVIGYNSQGCSDTDMVSIGIHDTPSVAILGDDTICAGESVSLFCTGNGSFQWSPSTGLNSTTTQNVIATPSATITYVCQIVDINGCTGSDTFDLYIDACVGIDPVGELKDVSVYPNPANDYVDITVQQGEPFAVRLFDATGQVVIEQTSNLSSLRLDFSAYSNGTYILVVLCGENLYTEKLILQR